jgi:hypothetical protein
MALTAAPANVLNLSHGEGFDRGDLGWAGAIALPHRLFVCFQSNSSNKFNFMDSSASE